MPFYIITAIFLGRIVKHLLKKYYLEKLCLKNCFVSYTQCTRDFLFPGQESGNALAQSIGIFMVFVAHQIIFHSPCSRLAPGIELLPLKHDSLLHLYFPLHSILRLGNPALLLFIVGHKWMAENFRGECNTLKACTIYRYNVHLKTRTKPQTDAWLNNRTYGYRTALLVILKWPAWEYNMTLNIVKMAQ